MHDDLAHWYRTLELEPGASLEEVNQAYKDLAVVWHPDRLPQDSTRLQEKAQAKLKEINNARDRLRGQICPAHLLLAAPQSFAPFAKRRQPSSESSSCRVR